ncbi:uncharacterized protein LOC113305282 [Papaver somniferum]|uniref:uncharacterized protein LOC113305282 n=1 Tax=Papaver somniferum TaxID=3469 RepID=UPI000E70313A|nr:uncharacterized protein LOC113305282 [Papaver somniferum]
MGDKIREEGVITKIQDDLVEESSNEVLPQQQQHSIVVNTSSLISTESLYIAPPPNVLVVGGGSGSSTTSSQFEHHQDETVNPKRPKFGAGQWKKIIPSPHQQRQQQQQHHPKMFSSPSPNDHQKTLAVEVPTSTPHTTQTSTSSTPPTTATSSPISPSQETNKPFQIRKGKFVSPVWKPNEMLWLAKAWRAQYQDNDSNQDDIVSISTSSNTTTTGRGKTRSEKDREVAEFLNRNGVNRDAKTSGTKWDNMLGEFRKVYEWEKTSNEKEINVGNTKSYFRLSPYERKLHKLPASFDEDVFYELSQFMGIRVRITSSTTSSPHQNRSLLVSNINDPAASLPETTAGFPSLPQPPLPHSFKEEDSAGRLNKQGMESRGNEVITYGGPSSSTSTSREFRRIGRIRMTWEESVNLWAEEQEGDHHHQQQQRGGGVTAGRVKLQGLGFLNANELTFFDETMAGCTMEAYQEGPLKGFSIDRFICGQQVKVFGRRSNSSSNPSSGLSDRFQLGVTEKSNNIRSKVILKCLTFKFVNYFTAIPPWEYQDPSEYYIGCLKVPPTSLPSLFELSWHLQEPPSEELRFPLRKDVYRDLPQGKELFFTTTAEPLDCRAITFDILSPIVRSNLSISVSTATSRDSFISLWDDCINRVVSKFCSQEMVVVRKPCFSSSSSNECLQDQWPNVTGFTRNFCLWRGEEIDKLREGNLDPSSSIIEKILWTYTDLPYILGYYAIGYSITFCALSRSQDRVIRTDLYSVDLSTPADRLKSLIPCWRIAGLLTLLAERCFNSDNISRGLPYSDFEQKDIGGGNLIEMTPNTVKRSFSSRRKFTAVKEIYDFLNRRIPHAEYIFMSSEKDLAITYKPRGCKSKPINIEQLVESLKFVTKALVALHDLSFMHRDLSWEKVMKRSDRENEWFVSGFEEAVGAPQIYPSGGVMVGARHAPEMGRGLHGVKVDVWGVGMLVKTSGLGVPLLLRELQNRCLDQNPELRPTSADCYHHLLQLQSSLCVAPGGF